MASEELTQKSDLLSNLEKQISDILKPKTSSFNAIVEIQAGTGGDESSLFVEILFTMYAKYAKKQNWNVEITDLNDGNQGGFKYISCVIEGSGSYDAFKNESGSHKIQRVSPTDTAKRVHTSAATVIVLPEIEISRIEVKKSDVKVDTFRAGGPGGQSQNMTDSGVRLTHLPTGIVVSIRDGKSQTQNKIRAWKILVSRIDDFHRSKEEEKQITQQRELRGDGSRGGCIRTYNFPQDRFTDHRIEQSWFGLDKLLQGNIGQILNECNQLI